MNRSKWMLVVAASAAVAAIAAADAQAQCTTCATPTVAYYQPAVQTVAYQPTITYEPYTGWYPGRLFDRMRLRWWSRRAQPTTYATANAPYVTAYAPLQSSAQTAYYQPATSASACNGCAQTVYRPVVQQTYYPVAAYQPVIMRPVVTMRPVVQTSYTTVDAGCASCVDQATYSAPVGSDCTSCSDGYTTSTTVAPAGEYYGPDTPQPEINGAVPTPADRGYRGDVESEGDIDGSNGGEVDGASIRTEAPPLLRAPSDQLTRRPSVEVRHAVYRPAARTARANSQRSRVVSPKTPVNVDGWRSAP